MDYYYEGIQRLDWGFGNPNMTAALIAMLAVAVCGVAVVWKKAFWFALPIATGLMVALIHTLSRGGMVAFLAGFIALLIAVRPRLGRVRMGSMLVVACLLVGYAHHLGGAARYVQGVNGVEDRSLGNRWLIYRTVPRMLLDAPGGWGKGKAADVYHQWYQPEERSETYLNLVNSHFTWMVEWPTWARLLYCLGWAFVFLLAWPDARHRWWGIVFGVWMALFAASCFSSVAHRPWIWPFPVAMLLVLLVHRILVMRKLPRRNGLLLSTGAALGAYALLLLAAFLPSDVPTLRNKGTSVVIGSSQAPVRIALCGTDRAILGEKFGHRLRDYVKEHPAHSITLYETPAAIDSTNHYQTTVLVGDALENFDATTQGNLVLLNPTAPKPEWTPREESSVRVLWGDLNPSPAWYAWQRRTMNTKHITINRQLGEGLYLENWLNEIPQ